MIYSSFSSLLLSYLDLIILSYHLIPIVSQTTPAPPLRSPVPTSAVCLQDGTVTGTMTALMAAMSRTVPLRCLAPVLPASLPVPTTAVSHTPGAATLTMTVGTVRMRLTAVSFLVVPVELCL